MTGVMAVENRVPACHRREVTIAAMAAARAATISVDRSTPLRASMRASVVAVRSGMASGGACPTSFEANTADSTVGCAGGDGALSLPSSRAAAPRYGRQSLKFLPGSHLGAPDVVDAIRPLVYRRSTWRSRPAPPARR